MKMSKKNMLLFYIIVSLMWMGTRSENVHFFLKKVSNDPTLYKDYMEQDLYGTSLEENIALVGNGFNEKSNFNDEFFADNFEYYEISKSENDYDSTDFEVAIGVVNLFFGGTKNLNYLEINSVDTESVINALNVILEKNYKVVFLDFNTQKEEKIEKKLTELSDQGIIVLAAAGDDGLNEVNYPASSESVISVGAAHNSKNIWKNSNISEKNLYFPGVNIHNGNGTVLTTTRISSAIAAWYITEMIHYDENVTKEEIISNIEKINKGERGYEYFFYTIDD